MVCNQYCHRMNVIKANNCVHHEYKLITKRILHTNANHSGAVKHMKATSISNATISVACILSDPSVVRFNYAAFM